jgi:hypothetical protein
MADISIEKGSVSQSVNLRFLDLSTAGFAAEIDETTEDLEVWYRRDGGPKVNFTAVSLSSLEAPWRAGGIENIGDGYVRIDVPDAAFDFGADNVLVGGSAHGYMAIGLLIDLVAAATTLPSSSGPTSATQQISCNMYLPEADTPTHEGCPVVTKRRHIPVQKGICGTALWTMRLPNGRAANFSDCTSTEYVSLSESASVTEGLDKVMVRFSGCDRGCGPIAEVEGNIADAETGKIQFDLPDAVCQNSGIYFFQAALMRDDSPFFIDSGGIISVEQGLWGNTGDTQGPPTINEIRYAIMDRVEENTLLRAVEFDDSDILEAIRWPVLQFNELSPDLGIRYNCSSFPFRYHWIQGIVGRLLSAAVNHYMRNKMQATSGGLTVDDKNRDTDYLRLSKMYQDEWLEWAQVKKIELNAGLAYGDITSRYGGYTGYGW